MSNATDGVNRAKTYQLVLFPLNNGATNVYYVLILTYIATFGNKVLGIAMVFASFMVTGMRVFDAITDPIIGALMDKTNGKFGKFRPFMVIGSLIMALSVIALYVLTPYIPANMMWLRYALYILLYAIWVLGYTCQTSVTRAAQAVLTNDPKQRPLFTIFNTVGSLAGMGLMQFIGPIMAGNGFAGDYNRSWFAIMTPIGICISVALTILAIIGIWEKDQPKYFGIGGGKTQKVKISEYVQIIKQNKPLQRLMVAGGGCKLALSIATNITVLIMLYSCMMLDYDGLYLPMMVLGYVFAVPFFGLTVNTSQKKGQKASLSRYVAVAFICYIGVAAMMLMWNPNTGMHMMISDPDTATITASTGEEYDVKGYAANFNLRYVSHEDESLVALFKLPVNLNYQAMEKSAEEGAQVGVYSSFTADTVNAMTDEELQQETSTLYIDAVSSSDGAAELASGGPWHDSFEMVSADYLNAGSELKNATPRDIVMSTVEGISPAVMTFNPDGTYTVAFEQGVTETGTYGNTQGGFHINLYTILFVLLFGIGYGAYYATADMPIPMVADCADYETYRSGKFIPGIMGTLFSLVDKLVSSLSATVVSIAVLFIGLSELPTKATPFVPGMNWVVIVLFCVIPMCAWALTLWSMKGYELDGQRVKEIQAINAARKAAVAEGMSLEDAMAKYQTLDQVPEQFRSK